jgi:predicted RNA-binding protein with TRAM domain
MSNRRPAAAEPHDEAANVTIGDLSHDGRGVARADGKIVFVPGALPGADRGAPQGVR